MKKTSTRSRARRRAAPAPAPGTFCVVGAGVFGAVVAERIATKLGAKVLVLEKRKDAGGNSRSFFDPATGIECHEHGSHIFHTKDAAVWDYVRRFAAFTPYRHKVMLTSRGRVFGMPINLKTINDWYGAAWSPDEARRRIAAEIAREGISEPANLEEKAVSLVGRGLYECAIRDYTAKQWGRDPRELPESIIRRLPVRYDYVSDYFDTPWQGVPADGYGALFRNLLDRPGIELRTGVDFRDVRASLPAGTPVVYTGMPDELFDFRYGALEWRSLRFEWETVPVRDFQGTAVMNYGDASVPYTRIHEFKHYNPERADAFARPATVICREYPAAWKPGAEAYYPVNDAANQARFARYRALAAAVPGLRLGGRLGSYAYWDMDRAVAEALRLFDRLARGEPDPPAP